MTHNKLLILAAGNGTRLGPITAGGYPKPLVDVYDKPCIYYSIAAAIASGHTQIGIIIQPGKKDLFVAHFGYGASLGITIEYIEQPVQRGIADAFVVAKDFIGADGVTLMLGDNIFIGESFAKAMLEASNSDGSATVFALRVPLAEAPKFGVVEFRKGKAVSIEEKPEKPKSPFIIPGVYFYDNSVVEAAHTLQPSARGEYEISDLNQLYLERGDLRVVELSNDVDWHDTGTADTQLEAANAVQTWYRQHGTIFGSPEVEALKAGLISVEQFTANATQPGIVKSAYGEYLQQELDAYLSA